jgi:glycosyltransferase involved in cell wall biosynthesis
VLDEFDASWALWVALAFALLVCILLIRARWNLAAIPRLRLPADARPPDCMVVIPARDEERLIERAVRSLPHDSVIVVDDHSTDNTSALASKAGAGVIPAPDLGRGAIGKSNACMAGARALESRWILFTDADTWFEEGFLSAAVAAAEASGVAFLSIHLESRPRSWRDAVIMPLAQAIGYASIRPRGDPTTAFQGQCILVRRDGYEFVGGHAAALNTLAEDAKLAALAERHRLKIGVARSGSLGHVDLREAAISLRRRGFRLMILDPSTMVVSMTAATVLALWPAAAVWAGFDSGWSVAAALLIGPMLVALLWYRSAWVIFMPLAVYGVAARLWSGLIAALGGSPIEWKGRDI